MPDEIIEQPTDQPVEAPAAAPAEAPAQQEETKDAQSQETQTEPAADESQPRDEKGRFKNPTQERIDELTRARREAEREAAYWRSRATPEKAPEPAAKPDVKNFEDYNEYVEALADWKADQKVSEALKARDTQTAKTAEERALEARERTFAERVTHAKSQIADFDQVVGAADVNVAQHVTDAILDSEKGAEMLYHLAKNPQEAERLSRMSVREADREIGRIEASLGKPAAPVTKPASNAPAPMRPASRGGSTVATTDPNKMSHEEYRAWRSSQGARWAK